MKSGHNLEHLSDTEYMLYLECAVAAMQAMLTNNSAGSSYPFTCAVLAFDAADAMVAEYRNRFEPNERIRFELNQR